MLEKLKQRVTIYAGLDTLEYLYKGGRISRTEAILAGYQYQAGSDLYYRWQRCPLRQAGGLPSCV